MSRSMKKVATAGALAAMLGTSACATAEDEALLWSVLGLATDIAIYDYMLDNCSFYTSDYGYGQNTYTDCRDRDRRHHRDRDHHRD